MAAPTTRTPRPPQTSRSAAPVRRRLDRVPPPEPSRLSDGAVIDRLIRMRVACKALAIELADTRRELKGVRAELRRAKQRLGES